MVLIDTSVWIHYFADRLASYKKLDELSWREEVVAHPLVFGELLIGDLGRRRSFLERYEQLYQSTFLRHEEVVAFVRTRNLHVRGIGWIDAHILASALVDGTPLWTADPRLRQLAREYGIDYSPE